MPPFRTRRSLLAFATCLTPAFIIASPLAASGIPTEDLGRRSNNYHIPCGNAPSVIAGYPVTAADIVVPSQDVGPPLATTDPSGYFPYLWCGVGVSTYVFIDPIGNYGYNKGTNNPIFATGLDGGINATKNAINAQGDGATEVDPQWLVSVSDIAGDSGIQYVQFFAQSANKNKLTWGELGSALAIMKDFVQTYPLYADTMYFQISDSHYGTTGNGYMGVRFNGSTSCWLKGSTAQENGVPCAMPSDYPDN